MQHAVQAPCRARSTPGKAEQIAYWDSFAKQGVSDQAARASALTFRAEFDKLNGLLAKQSYLHSNALTVLDIAWFIYVNRLSLAGYPIARLHPRLNGWFEALLARPEFSREIEVPPPLKVQIESYTAPAHGGWTVARIGRRPLTTRPVTIMIDWLTRAGRASLNRGWKSCTTLHGVFKRGQLGFPGFLSHG